MARETGNSEGIRTGVHKPLRHDSAHKHVNGEAIYIDDMPEPPGMLNVAFGMSEHPHARIRSMDLGRADACPRWCG